MSENLTDDQIQLLVVRAIASILTLHELSSMSFDDIQNIGTLKPITEEYILKNINVWKTLKPQDYNKFKGVFLIVKHSM